jgi:hypothetical protein
MEQVLDVHRLHLAFTIHVSRHRSSADDGVALLLVYLETKALPTRDTAVGGWSTHSRFVRSARS